jgi:hypothetical protein
LKDNQKKGKGLYLNNYQGKGISDLKKNQMLNCNLPDNEKNKLKDTCKKLKSGCRCKIRFGKHGEGLFLSPPHNKTD